MDKRFSVKIPPSSRKKRIGKKVFERNVKKLANRWCVTDENAKARRKVLFNLGKRSSSKLSKPVDDITRKLLEISNSQVEDASETVDEVEHLVTKRRNRKKAKRGVKDVNGVPSDNNKTVSASTNEELVKEVDSDEVIEILEDNEKNLGNNPTTEKEQLVKEEESDEVVEISDEESGTVENELEQEDGVMEREDVEDDNNEDNIESVENHVNVDEKEELVDIDDESVIDETEESDEHPEGDSYEKVFDDVFEDEQTVFPWLKVSTKAIPSCSKSDLKQSSVLPVVIRMEADDPGPKNFFSSDSPRPVVPYKRHLTQLSSVPSKKPCLDSDGDESLPEATPLPPVSPSSILPEVTQSYVFHILPNGKVLMGLKYPNCLCFQGKLRVSVLAGTVEVLGYEMSAGDRNTVYSPRGVSLLGFCVSQPRSGSLDLSSVCDKPNNLSDVNSKLNEFDCVLLLANATSPVIDFIDNNFPLKLFPLRGILSKGDEGMHEAEEILHCKFALPGTDKLKFYSKTPEWEAFIQDIDRNGKARIVVCGGKSVGKSTFLRYLVNKCISKFKKVLYLDLDPGQSEFTVPGCVSAVLVTEPLLGPNYLHLQTPLRTVYIGEINVSRCPGRYLESVQHIIEYCHSQPQFSNIPWFINTMGFNKGLGVELTVTVIRMVGPTNVVQIQSSLKTRNFPERLESAYVCDYPSTFSSPSCDDLAYKFHELPSVAEKQESEEVLHWGMEAHKLRDLVILSYLSQSLSPGQQSLTEVVPFIAPFSKLTLCVCHEAIQYLQYLSAMNCSLVALCTVGDKNVLVPSNPEYPRILSKLPVCPCLGFGVVRGVDMQKKEVYLITPLSQKELSQVNCLVLGPVSLPAGLLLNRNNITGCVPYVMVGVGQPTGQNMRASRSVAGLHKRRRNIKR